MRIRSLLTLLFAGSFVTIIIFTCATVYVLGMVLGIHLPQMLVINSFYLSGNALLIAAFTALSVWIILVLGSVYLILNTDLIRPLQSISYALDYFAEHNALTALPEISHPTKEIQALNEAFVRFTQGVEAVHTRDMEISRVKSDFISTAAHQLRTPLTAIRWALEALQIEPLTPDQQALVKNAVDKSHDLVAIVGTLLDISSIESGKYKYSFAPVDLSALVTEVVNDFMPLSQKNSVNLLLVPSPTALPQVRADRERVKWVLNNLVENALRYTPAQGYVRVSINGNDTRVFVHVSDTGIGIPSSDRNNIFERFFRAGNAIAKENQGNGLGLYIARQIALDHGGDLGFEANTESTGTTFTLSIPTVNAVIAPVVPPPVHVTPSA